jgi:lysozyme
MIINDAGRKIIETYEGCKLEAYRCPAGIWTIGFGHTGDVLPGMKVTQHQADTVLEYDLERFESAVGKLCPQANANQFSALVCFAFNVGVDALKSSTLLRKFLAGDVSGAAEEFLKWTHAAGKELPGLVKRRAAERALFLTVPS